jgi:hypothetical protein
MATILRLTDAHLIKTLASWPNEFIEDHSQRSFWLSIAIAKYFFGQDWIDEHVRPNGPAGFLRQDDQDKVRSEEQGYRIVDLAELLFNLQNVEGFDDCIDRMRHGLIEPTYAELDLGRMLYLSEVSFHFVKPQGKKENDYDIEISLPDWPRVCADAKCKLETTYFTPNTVRNALGTARKQFPPDLPSIVFMKVPSQWRDIPQPVTDVLYEVAAEFLRGTGRIVSVKYYTSRIVWRGGALTHVQSFKEFSNPRNRFDPNRNWNMFTEADEIASPNARGEFSDVPKRWRRLLYYPDGLFTVRES